MFLSKILIHHLQDLGPHKSKHTGSITHKNDLF